MSSARIGNLMFEAAQRCTTVTAAKRCIAAEFFKHQWLGELTTAAEGQWMKECKLLLKGAPTKRHFFNNLDFIFSKRLKDVLKMICMLSEFD